MSNHDRTYAFITVTDEGVIDHFKHPSGILLPVKVRVKNDSKEELGKYPSPIRRGGKLVYALPGGGDYIP